MISFTIMAPNGSKHAMALRPRSRRTKDAIGVVQTTTSTQAQHMLKPPSPVQLLPSRPLYNNRGISPLLSCIKQYDTIVRVWLTYTLYNDVHRGIYFTKLNHALCDRRMIRCKDFKALAITIAASEVTVPTIVLEALSEEIRLRQIDVTGWEMINHSGRNSYARIGHVKYVELLRNIQQILSSSGFSTCYFSRSDAQDLVRCLSLHGNLVSRPPSQNTPNGNDAGMYHVFAIGSTRGVLCDLCRMHNIDMEWQTSFM